MKVLVCSFSFEVFIKDLDKNIKLVNDFVKKGNMFVIATGKNINEVCKIIGSKQLNCSYYICNDGASIFDQYMDIIYRLDIKNDYVKPIYNALINELNGDVRIDVSTCFSNKCSRYANKIVAKYINYDKALKISNTLNYKFDSLRSYLSHNYINIVNKKASKGNGVKFLIDFYNFNKNDIYAVVKDDNDISLNVFNSFVVGNSKNFNKKVSNLEQALKMIER